MKPWIASLFLLAGIVVNEAAALDATKTRVVLWRKSETIQGEEFIVLDEKVVDYLATLPRPTEALKGFKYDCMVKSRLIQPTAYSIGGTGTQNSYVDVRTVYELRDCEKVN